MSEFTFDSLAVVGEGDQWDAVEGGREWGLVMDVKAHVSGESPPTGLLGRNIASSTHRYCFS
jgi:hypothetical protein